MYTGRQGLTLFTAVVFLVGVVVVVQLWLLSAALDAALSGEGGLALPATVASLALCLLNAGLLWYVFDFDRRRRRAEAE